jgi:hypothetical protein
VNTIDVYWPDSTGRRNTGCSGSSGEDGARPSDEYGSVYAACLAIGPKVGVGVESLRRWTVQAQIDARQEPGPTSAERQRIKDLEREVRDLKEPHWLLSGPGLHAGSRAWVGNG